MRKKSRIGEIIGQISTMALGRLVELQFMTDFDDGKRERWQEAKHDVEKEVLSSSTETAWQFMRAKSVMQFASLWFTNTSYVLFGR